MNRSQLDAWYAAVVDLHATGKLPSSILTGATEAAAEVKRQWSQVSELRARAQYSTGNDGLWLSIYGIGMAMLVAAEHQRNGKLTQDDTVRCFTEISEAILNLVPADRQQWAQDELERRLAKEAPV